MTVVISCPVCAMEMMEVKSDMKLTLVIEGRKTFSPSVSLKICPSCGNVQYFVDVKEVKPLLKSQKK